MEIEGREITDMKTPTEKVRSKCFHCGGDPCTCLSRRITDWVSNRMEKQKEFSEIERIAID